jgi:uncharacterized protein YndB with AHSA1/START domain
MRSLRCWVVFAALANPAIGGAQQTSLPGRFVPAPIEASVLVPAPIEDVWNAWTTSQGVPTFMGLGAEIDARPRGVFRVAFDLARTAPLDRGNDGIVLAVEPQRMLSVSWMTPMHMANLRGNSTLLTVYFEKLDDPGSTRVRIVNSGYGVGDDWAAAHAYNVNGWPRVLSALEYRFRTGPIDWDWAMREMRKSGRWPWNEPVQRTNESDRREKR